MLLNPQSLGSSEINDMSHLNKQRQREVYLIWDGNDPWINSTSSVRLAGDAMPSHVWVSRGVLTFSLGVSLIASGEATMQQDINNKVNMEGERITTNWSLHRYMNKSGQLHWNKEQKQLNIWY